MGAMATYVRAGLPEVATALAALTGEPHPLAIKDPGTDPPANTGLDPGSPYSSAAFVSSRAPARRRQGTAQSYTEIVKAIDARSAEEQGCRFSS